MHVCDDGTTPEAKEMIAREFPHVTWHVGPRRGPAANRNLGARMAKGRWLLFVDDDCLPRPTFLPTYLAEMQNPAASAKILYGPTFRMGELDSLVWEAPHNPTGEQLISCNFAVLKETFFETGCFDERYPVAAFEDTELEDRFRLRKTPIRFLDEAAVDHPLRPLPASFKLSRRWESRVISTHDLGASAFQISWKLPRHILAIIVSRLRGRPFDEETRTAGFRYAGEFLWVMWQLPGWMSKHCRAARSAFWIEQVKLGNGPRNFGL